MNKERFTEAIKLAQKAEIKASEGEILEVVTDDKYSLKLIGTLSEKILHKTLKFYFEENSNFHEIKIGSFYADICKDNNVIEIQTRSFNKLREKLKNFLVNKKVTIVYPIFPKKWLIWIDNETGETTAKRKSPKKGNIYDALAELYKIKFFLDNPNLSIHLVFLEVDEYRNLDGWSANKKHGSSRYKQIPIDLIDEKVIQSINDYYQFLPPTLPDIFTVKDFKKESKLTLYKSQLAISVFKYLKIITQTGKEGKAFLYKRTDKM